MKKSILSIAVLAATMMFTSCDYNARNFPELDENGGVTDIKTFAYTMTAEDYAAVASNSTNKSMAATAEVSADLAAVKTQQAFSVAVPASAYAPAFLAAKWPTADNGSAVKLTYNMQQALPDYILKLNAASVYTLSTQDYTTAWGATGTKYLSPDMVATALPTVLLEADSAAVNGAIKLVTYTVGIGDGEGDVEAVNEDFEQFTSTVNVAQVDGWFNVGVAGTNFWQGRTYSNNGYLQSSAYGQTGALDVYMITPEINVVDGMTLTFDMCYRYYAEAGGRLQVLVSSNFRESTDSATLVANVQAANWTDITSNFTFGIPAAGASLALANAGSYDLSTYANQRVHIAFRYVGDGSNGATTTCQFDNVVIKKEAEGANVTLVPTNALYTFNGTAWVPYTAKSAMVLQASNFSEMGINNDNFSSSNPADRYLPIYLASQFPYATEGTTKIVVYKYYANSATSVAADEYVLTSGTWVKNTALETLTDQFVKTNGVWVYDPSVVISLDPIRNDAAISAYYQAVVDWVWENVDVPAGCTNKGEGYVSSYGNNEYYTGCSAYYNNVDMRPAKAREQIASAYDGMSDDEVIAKMEERLKEVLAHALAKLHPDAAPIDGVEVTYTVRVPIYTGTSISACTHQLVYKVVAAGTFEYVEDSFQPLQ